LIDDPDDFGQFGDGDQVGSTEPLQASCREWSFNQEGDIVNLRRQSDDQQFGATRLKSWLPLCSGRTYST
jgi:hypothetical protein